MDVTYIYDLKMQFDGTYYYAKNFSSEVWERYEFFGGKIHIYPFIQSEQKKDWPPISSKQLVIHRTPLQKTKHLYTKFGMMRKLARQIVLQSEAIIIRMPSQMGIFVGLECIKQQKPYIVEVVGNAQEAFSLYGNVIYRAAAPIFHNFTKKVVKYAHSAIYVTKSYLQKCYPNQNSYDIKNNYVLAVAQNDLELQFPIKIGMIGALNTNIKGHKTLFEALAILDKENIPIEIRLLGEGQLNRNVSFNKITLQHDGIIAHEAIIGWFQQLNFYVQPSNTEAISRSILEAMSFGLPVVASNVGGVAELVDQPFLIERGNSEQLAQKLLALITNDTLRKEASNRNYQYVQQYTKEIMQSRREAAFKQYMHRLRQEQEL